MKKFAILILVISGFTLGSMRLVNGQQANLESPPVTPEFTMSGITNVIDGIEVPQEVLEYVQLTYDGHAVTKAQRTVRDGQNVYRLRVDRDDLQNDYSSFSLIFSTDWKLLGRERAEVPKPKPEPVKVKPQDKPKPENEDKPQQERPKPEQENEDKPVGGSGGGTESTGQTSEEETEETTDSESSTGTQTDDDTGSEAATEPSETTETAQ